MDGSGRHIWLRPSAARPAAAAPVVTARRPAGGPRSSGEGVRRPGVSGRSAV